MLPLNDLRLDSLLQPRASGAGVAEQLSRLSGAGVSLAGVPKDTLGGLYCNEFGSPDDSTSFFL